MKTTHSLQNVPASAAANTLSSSMSGISEQPASGSPLPTPVGGHEFLGVPAPGAPPDVSRSLPRPATRSATGSPSLSLAREDGQAAVAARRTVRLAGGDEYNGEVAAGHGGAVPHGRGVLACRGRRCQYAGEFSRGLREGLGRLGTDCFVVWGSWRRDRLDPAASCRLDLSGGDRYHGQLATRASDAALPHNGGGSDRPSEPRPSPFAASALALNPVRQGWGEQVAANGDRYFGQWAEDRPHGFGCYLSGGDRYVGRFRHGRFHDTGTLFARTFAQDGVPRLIDGAFAGTGGGDTGSAAALPPATARLCVFDGVWADGKFAGEGHVTLPSGSRISAEWRDASLPMGGEAVLRRGHSSSGTRWAERFHWEPLLCGASDEQRDGELAAAEPFRQRLDKLAASRPGGAAAADCRAVLVDFLSSGAQLQTALRVFRRCFSFHYGTCGSSAELGAGQRDNPLGWCARHGIFGGCIHPARGAAITAADLSAALTDIFSLARSVLRWTADLFGAERLEWMDGLGVPVGTVVGRWTADAALKDSHGVLLNLYLHVYAAEEAEVCKALARLRGAATLDDMGVAFARRQSAERLFDPYADAAHCIEQLCAGGHTLSSKLDVLTQWTRAIDLSTRLARTPAVGGSASSPPSPQAGGSADDLLPIHQYVLSQSRLRHLHAHARMLADFAEEAAFVDPSSQESFCVTTLLVCVSTLPRLHHGLRDGDGVLVPASVFTGRLRAAVGRVPAAAAAAADRLGMGRADLAAAALGYLASWVPEALACLAAAPRPLPPVVALTAAASAGPLPPSLRGAAGLAGLEDGGNPSAAAAGLRLFCWRVLGTVLGATGLHVGFAGPVGPTGRGNIVPCTLDDATETADIAKGLVVLVSDALLPSFLLLISNELRHLL